MDIGFDPISLENIKVDKWLKEDKDNIVIFLDDSIKNSKRILLLNKSLFRLVIFLKSRYLMGKFQN